MHAQVDLGEAVDVIAGVTRKQEYFATTLPHSAALLVKTCSAKPTESFYNLHVTAFSNHNTISSQRIPKVCGPVSDICCTIATACFGPFFLSQGRNMVLADPFRIIAHRGASGYAPENTMAAFQRAVELGATEVETDVTLTRDGQLLLFHDDTLERTTNGSGRPEDYTLAELLELDAGSWHDPQLSWDRDYTGEKLITLGRLLDRFDHALTYHIELKKPMEGLPEAVVAAVQARGLASRTFLCSIADEAGLKRAKKIEPCLRIAWAPETMLRDQPCRAVERCAANGFSMITLNPRNQSRELVQFAHSLGLEARSSGISSRERMLAAVEIGCNGMTINWPDWLVEYVRRNAEP